MNDIVRDFLEEKDEQLVEKVFCVIKKCFFYLAFTVYVTSHPNDLNLKLQGKANLIPRLVNDISALKMKSKPFILCNQRRKSLHIFVLHLNTLCCVKEMQEV